MIRNKCVLIIASTILLTTQLHSTIIFEEKLLFKFQDSSNYRILYSEIPWNITNENILQVNIEILSNRNKINGYVVLYQGRLLGPFKYVDKYLYSQIHNTIYFIAIDLSNKVQVFYGTNHFATYDYIDRINNFNISDNAEIIYYLASSNNMKYFVFSDKSYGPYNDIVDYTINEGGTHFAISASISNRYYLIRNNTQLGPFKHLSGLEISPDGNKIIYLIKNEDSKLFFSGDFGNYGPFYSIFDKKGDWSLILINEKERFHPSYKNPLFITISNSHKYLLLDDIHFGPIDDYMRLLFNRNGTPIGIISKNKNYFVQIGNERFGPYKNVSGINFSPDGIVPWYSAIYNSRWYIYIGGKQSSGPYSCDECYPIFNNENNIIAFSGKGGDERPVVDYKNKRYGPFPKDPLITITPDNSNIAFVRNNNFKSYLFIGNSNIGPYDSIWRILFNPKDGHLVYGYSINNNNYIKDGSNISGPYAYPVEPKYNIEGSVLYYEANYHKKRYFVVNNTKYGPYDFIEDIHCPSGGSNVFFTGSLKKKWYLQAGNKKIGPFDNVSILQIGSNGKRALYIARIANEIYQNIVTLE